jgi:hypothetical protein
MGPLYFPGSSVEEIGYGSAAHLAMSSSVHEKLAQNREYNLIIFSIYGYNISVRKPKVGVKQ